MRIKSILCLLLGLFMQTQGTHKNLTKLIKKIRGAKKEKYYNKKIDLLHQELNETIKSNKEYIPSSEILKQVFKLKEVDCKNLIDQFYKPFPRNEICSVCNLSRELLKKIGSKKSKGYYNNKVTSLYQSLEKHYKSNPDPKNVITQFYGLAEKILEKINDKETKELYSKKISSLCQELNEKIKRDSDPSNVIRIFCAVILAGDRKNASIINSFHNAFSPKKHPFWQQKFSSLGKENLSEDLFKQYAIQINNTIRNHKYNELNELKKDPNQEDTQGKIEKINELLCYIPTTRMIKICHKNCIENKKNGNTKKQCHLENLIDTYYKGDIIKTNNDIIKIYNLATLFEESCPLEPNVYEIINRFAKEIGIKKKKKNTNLRSLCIKREKHPIQQLHKVTKPQSAHSLTRHIRKKSVPRSNSFDSPLSPTISTGSIGIKFENQSSNGPKNGQNARLKSLDQEFLNIKNIQR